MMRHEYVIWTICLAISWGQFLLQLVKVYWREHKRQQEHQRKLAIYWHRRQLEIASELQATVARHKFSSPYR